MKTYPFEEFMKSNGLSKEHLSPMLQKRILGFEELREDFEHTVDGDREKMQNNLDDIADELEEDLYEEFEDHLENNPESEDQLDEDTIRKEKDRSEKREKFKEKLVKKAEQEKIEREKLQKKMEREKEEKEKQEKEKKEKILKAEENKAPVLSPDENLIEKLYKSGHKKIGRSGLVSKGFKTKLEGKKIQVGKYKLVKALFSYSYSIELS